MIFTVIYQQNQHLGTFTFASVHDKNKAWYDFVNNHAEPGQKPLAICPGNTVIYFEDCISPEESYHEAG
tara:strand:+ start:418 stop:624 length:207 start_codon:yes stop_codon:yes gene_type:complete